MSEPVRYLLVDKSISSKISTKISEGLALWQTAWNLDKKYSGWDVALGQGYEMLDFVQQEQSFFLDTENGLLLGACFDEALQWVENSIAGAKVRLADSHILNHLVERSYISLLEHIVKASIENVITTPCVGSDKTNAFSKSVFLKVVISGKQGSFELFLSLEFIARLVGEQDFELKKSGGLVKRELPVSEEKYRVKVDYGSAMLSVSELSSISVGDVICLDEAADSPLNITNQRGKHLLSAHLGVKDNNLALKIVK